MMKRWNALLTLAASAVLIAVLMHPFSAWADEDRPSSDAAEKTPPTAKDFTLMAYERTKTATTERDYATIVYLLERALRSDALTPKYVDYSRRLKGWAHNRLGEELIKAEREAAALAQFELAVAMNPDHWKARHNRGVSYAVDAQLDKAIADFTETVRLKPKFANAWFNRAEAYVGKGEFGAAVSDYTQAIRLVPNDAGFYIARAGAHRRLGEFDRAVADFDRAIQLDANHAAAFVGRAELNVDRGAYESAAADFRQAVQLDKQLGSAYRGIAWLMATCPDERFRDSQRAAAFAERAIALDGDADYRYVETLAAAQASAQQFDAAVASQRKAFNLASQFAAPAAVIATLQSRLDQYQQRQPHRLERIARQPQDRRGPN